MFIIAMPTMLITGYGIFYGFNQAPAKSEGQYADNIPHGTEKQNMPCIPNPFKNKWKHSFTFIDKSERL